MKIGIFELAPRGHPPLVEAVAQIYASIPEHEIWIITHEQAANNLKFLASDQILLRVKRNDESYLDFFNQIKNLNLDKIFLITFEALSKENYAVIQAFCKMDFKIPIHLFLHNIDFWFQQNLFHKISNTLHTVQRVADIPYQLKLNFLYPSKNRSLLEMVRQSGGKFLVLSESVAVELSKYVAPATIGVIPFSVYKTDLYDTSLDNKRLRICIPGMISATRRDYDSILTMLERYEKDFKTTIELDLLGAFYAKEEGENVKKRVNQLIDKGFHIYAYHHWLEMNFYNEQLGKADIILGNLHLQQGKFGQYGKTKETGILFTMIKAGKPGLLPIGYPTETALQTSVLSFQNYDEVATIILNYLKNPNLLNNLKQNAKENALYYHPNRIYQRIETAGKVE
ncbi:MAG: hypothetical protein RL329_2126 [Bacteroidota bacterium]